MSQKTESKIGRIIDYAEETGIAICLGLMTIITFANVVARYVFNDNILWGLEATVYLFAWLVILGASYGVKKHIHIGVDVVINMVPPSVRKVLGIISISACLAFSILMLIGAWNYWYPYFNVNDRSWYETNDIPMPEMLQFMSDWINQGERYEKLPRVIPYFVMPLGIALLTFRFLQQAWLIITGKTDKIIAGHEVEEELEEVKATFQKK